MQAWVLKTPLIKPGDDILKIISSALKKSKFSLKNNDIVVIASKVIAVTENRIVNLKTITPSLKAQKLSSRYALNPHLIQLIIKEADQILGGVARALLTLKDNILTVNSGIDLSNVPSHSAILWPKNPTRTADKIQKFFQTHFKKRVGVIIVDSHCQPLRRGTTGLALAIAGFQGVQDERGKKDLFGQKIKITQRNLADNLASLSSFLMGEVAERTPLVIIRGVSFKLSSKKSHYLTNQLKISRKKCLFRDLYH